MNTLTAGQVVAIRAAFQAGGTRDQAAEAGGIPRHLLDRHMKAGGQLEAVRPGRRWRPPAPDPTPLELRIRAAEVRAAWPEARWLGQGDDLE